MNTIFITGIGTGIGKTIAAAIVTEALQADYWKPVQAGFDEGTDSEFLQSVISNKKTIIHSEAYKLKLAASPHIAAREEGIKIDLDKIYEAYLNIGQQLTVNGQQALMIEGAGGLLVPLNETEFVLDLIRKLQAKVILVSRNYLGSINHSLLTAKICKEMDIDVLGWIFNDQYMNYENEIVHWSGYKKIASVPLAKEVNKDFISQQAAMLETAFASL